MISGKLQRLLAATILGVAAVGCAANVDGTKTGSVKTGPAVKVTIAMSNGEAHGSGVYVGNGAILTAAHVAATPGKMQVIDDAGNKYATEVLWVNAKYDVAMIAVKDAKMRAATVDCAPVKVGDEVSTVGNPGGADFLTFWGKVAGKARKSDPWDSVFLADIRGTGGESGGPVYNSYGEVAGILVGGMIGIAYEGNDGTVDLSQTGITYVVPSSVICRLMGRV